MRLSLLMVSTGLDISNTQSDKFKFSSFPRFNRTPSKNVHKLNKLFYKTKFYVHWSVARDPDLLHNLELNKQLRITMFFEIIVVLCKETLNVVFFSDLLFQEWCVQGCIIRLVTLDALQCTENVVAQINRIRICRHARLFNQ